MFRLISRNEFSPQVFEEYPVWSEYYDYDEIEEIVNWGIDRNWLLNELKTKHTGNDHCYYPVLQFNPLPDRIRIFLKAQIITKNKKSFSGYVVNEDAYCIGLFINNSELLLNKNIPLNSQFQIANIKKLEKAIGNDYANIFPLMYETDLFTRLKTKICGKFTLNN